MSQILSNEFLILTSMFASIVLAGFAIVSFMQRDPAARRFRGATGSGEAKSENVTLVHSEAKSAALRMLEPFQKAIAQSDPEQVSSARARLIEAGFYRPSALEVYFTTRVVLGIALPILMVVANTFFLNVTGNRAMFNVVAMAAMGYYLPSVFITRRIDERRRAFKLGMPDALDMMLVGVEAGLSLPAAMQHIVDEFSETHPIISEQFQIAILEFQAGKSRADALRGLSTRMNLPETRTLASMIVQSESLGTSMAQTLRVMADELRMQRMLDAEKRASELPVKMSFPLVLCIFPALMAVAMVPAMIQSLTFFAGVNN